MGCKQRLENHLRFFTCFLEHMPGLAFWIYKREPAILAKAILDKPVPGTH